MRWSKRDLANRLGVGVRSVAVFESGAPWPVDQQELRRIFTAAGIEFADGGAPGVRPKLASRVLRGAVEAKRGRPAISRNELILLVKQHIRGKAGAERVRAVFVTPLPRKADHHANWKARFRVAGDIVPPALSQIAFELSMRFDLAPGDSQKIA